MNKSRYILLVIGILGIVAGIYNLTQSDTNNALLAFISGTSLVYGYFELGKK
jgi:uncharacterized membrane protein HdeD (DUF308 family)